MDAPGISGPASMLEKTGILPLLNGPIEKDVHGMAVKLCRTKERLEKELINLLTSFFVLSCGIFGVLIFFGIFGEWAGFPRQKILSWQISLLCIVVDLHRRDLRSTGLHRLF